MKKSHQISIVAFLVVILLGYSKLRDKPEDKSEVERSSGKYVVAPTAESFRFGELDFTSCELPGKNTSATTSAFCAPFKVAENRDQPDARSIDLKLALIRSPQAADDDFIVFLAGGPGQSAVDSWPQIAPALASARKNRHVLLLDQRGTGGSNALTCDGFAGDEEMLEFNAERTAQLTRQCLDEVSARADPRFYTTTDAVEDLEALRQALGAPRFDLVGVSYGTRVAQQFLKRHPEGVRSLVLDSVAPNELVLGAEFSRNLDDALKDQFANCAKSAECAKAFPDPYADLIRLRNNLREQPREVRFPGAVSFVPETARLDDFGLVGLIRLFAYSPETAALIPLAVQQSLAGNDAPMMGQIGILNEGVAELAGSGMQLSVICAEDVDRLPRESNEANTLMGDLMTEMVKLQCTIWPKGTRPPDFNEPASGDAPTLVLEGELDPVTPPRYGEQVVANLGNAKLIIAKGQGHNVIGRGCLPKLVGEFMNKLDPVSLDAACANELGPLPHFIDFNGAAP